MHKLVLKNVSRSYQLDKNKYFNALSNINLIFGNTGLVGIVGKSGSGKTTLLNIIAKIDNPTSGEIFLNGKKYSNKKRDNYSFYQKDVGIVFQNYQLLEDKSVIYNVALPLLIRGIRKRKAYSQAKSLLNYVNIKTEQNNQLCKTLSGGEKQRVAIARAIINNQSVILCDEPTGALDSKNSKGVMDLLKKISKTRLVIIVSHNLQIIDDYCNRKIELKDCRVVLDNKLRPYESEITKQDKTNKGLSNWTSSFSLLNFKKRARRNVFVITSLTISLIMANLVFGFMSGKDSAIKKATYRQLDYGHGEITKEEMVSNTGLLKLTKTVRPNIEEVTKNENINKIFEICPNFSSIMPQNPSIMYDEMKLENMSYTPIYSFEENVLDTTLVSKGYLPSKDTLNEVVINQKCYQTLKNKMGKDPLNEYINISHHFECNYVLEDGEYITDTFSISISCRIACVCDELSYLSTNKIYYSYLALENYMQESALLNLSTYFDNKITWYDRVINAEDYSYISGYSYLLFLKNYRDRTELNKVTFGEFTYSSNSLIIANSLISFLQVAEYALFLFLAITLVGAILIISIISFTNYCEDRKVSAILTTIGARNSDIEDIYLNESLLSSIIAIALSFSLSIPISTLANKLIYKYVSIGNLISIPFQKFLNIPFLYPLIIVFGIALIVLFATVIPIKFSQSKSLKLELQAND